MTMQEFKTQIEGKLETLAQHANLLDEIHDACTEHGEWTLAEVMENELNENIRYRRVLIDTWQEHFGRK